jgi:hypothetical protein
MKSVYSAVRTEPLNEAVFYSFNKAEYKHFVGKICVRNFEVGSKAFPTQAWTGLIFP